ncbi:MAG: hypothetical protein RL758_2456 [Pseudomonadota bacterium]|jgi:hypothetical protein
MTIRALSLLLALLSCAPLVSSQGTAELLLKPAKRQAPQPYEAISFVSEGPTYGNTDEAIRGRYHRVVLLAGALAYDHPTIRLETLTYGDEACCRRVVGAWDLELESVQSNGVSLPKAETAEFKFARWLGAHSFAFSYGTVRCKVLRVGQSKVTVTCSQ